MNAAQRFEAFVREYQDMVFATAVRLLGNPSEAEDVVQVVFLKAFERFDQIGASPAAGGWLKTVATHECLNHLSRYRARWRLFSEVEEQFEDTIVAEPTAPDHRVSTQDLEQALQQLPDHQRVPLVLFHFEDQSYQAIADTLGVSLGKVKTDIHRGREALKRALAPTHEAC
jgi:RNA polymerase sigma-70 factor (ECF subfamily)